MTKQEQIEEMAKHICSVCDWMEASGCMKGDIDDYTQCSRTMETAEAIYKAGYRQIREKNEKRDDLKAEIKQLKTECALLDDELRIARQETINVLNKLKGNIKSAIDTYFNKDGGGYYLAEDVINDIDELIKELINNAEDKS